ncbi:MAG TPA: hypothetical protein VMU02_01905 [bacterium]|nr:hypothetical protein [bacterium]
MNHLVSKPSPYWAVGLAGVGTCLLAWPMAESAKSVPGHRRTVRSLLWRPLALSTIVLGVCWFSSYVLTGLAWRLHDVKVAIPRQLAPQLLRAGLGVGDPGCLQLWAGTHLETVRVTFEGLGIYEVWFLLTALATLGALAARTSGWRMQCRRAATALAIIAAYAVLRFACLVVLATEHATPWLLVRQPFTSLSWLPLACWLRVPAPPYVLSGDAADCQTPSPASLRASRIARYLGPLSLLVAGLSLAFAAGFNDPGSIKRGRVVIDESHSNWEWTREPFDTTSFGIRAEYNYYCLAQYLGHFYHVRVSADTSAGALASALDSADVLIIKTPTGAYSESELDAFERFVRGGGGLLLIGDHTNLFGMSAYLNRIASRFNMRFRFDDTFDLETTGLSTYRRSRLVFHPAVRHLCELGFLTSCSIEGGRGIEPIIVGYGLGSEDVDYGHPNFFSNIAYDLADRFGLFLQAGAKRSGAGRVLLFTDSTCFSNFCMFSPGKAEILLGFVDYLNRRGARYPHARILAVATGLAAALAGFAAAWRRTGAGAGSRAPVSRRWSCLRPLVLVVVAGFAIGTIATTRLNACLYGPVLLREPLPTVLFDVEHSGASFFTFLGESPDRRWQQFAEFFMCAERLGLYPRAGSIGDAGVVAPQAVVIVDPIRRFEGADLDRLVAYVRGGGRLLMLDTPENSGSTANSILGRFGIQVALVPVAVQPGEVPGLPDFYPTLVALWTDARPAEISQRPPCFIKAFGKGQVMLSVNSFRYSDAVVGTPLDRRPPAEPILEVYSEIFRLLRGRVPAQASTKPAGIQ